MKHLWEVIVTKQDGSQIGFSFEGTSGQLANLVNGLAKDETIKNFITRPKP